MGEIIDQDIGSQHALYLGDCVDVTASLPSDSIGFSVFSPPFASLYTYSNNERDMGNHKTHGAFMEHFGFLVQELYRAMKPGRVIAIHCMDLPASKQHDGFIGLRDFRGDMIRAFEHEGFIYHSQVCIWKDPVVQMQRTKALGLLHKQLQKDSSISRQGMPDYLVMMRKPGDNDAPIEGELTYYVGEEDANIWLERERPDGRTAKVPTNGASSVDVWQRYASPVWWDIRQGNTLQYRNARDSEDERHVCPLQLDVIERALQLWSAEGDVVYSPFAGIGSELYVALKMSRYAIGAELKDSYFETAKRNIEDAMASQYDLFSDMA